MVRQIGIHKQNKVAAGVIEDSLFGAADAAGLPDAITMGIADALAGDIDFRG